MKDFQGTVSGIDVIATPGQPVRCLAFVSETPDKEVQVTTELHALQTVLELASSKKVQVEISYEDHGTENRLTRVHLLDRGRLETIDDAAPEVLPGLPPNVRSINVPVVESSPGYLYYAIDVDTGNAIAMAYVPPTGYSSRTARDV